MISTQGFKYSLATFYIGVNMYKTMKLTGKKSKYGQPLFECAECTELGINPEGHTCTYWLRSAELCWNHFQEYHA